MGIEERQRHHLLSNPLNDSYEARAYREVQLKRRLAYIGWFALYALIFLFIFRIHT